MLRVVRPVTIVALLVVAVNAGLTVVSKAQTRSDLPWMNTSLTPEQRADLLIAQMTLEQKVQQLSNDTRPAMDPANRPEGCRFASSGRHIQGIPALGIPTVRMTNGSTGIIGGDCQPNPVGTGVPSTVAVAATFNPDLGRQLGDILGDEARLHGHQVLLGPTVNPIRHPYGGRNYQMYSEDPYLGGLMGAQTILGIQAHGIHATAKHFAGNEQETSRRVSDSVIPPRALHEIYLLPFEMAVKDAQPASIMCSYNKLNGVSACSNAELLTTTLRQQWGFEGYVVTDRSALHDLGPSIKAGVDWELAHEMPVHYALEPQPDRGDNKASEGIRPALAAGTITVSDIDQMLRRRYIQMFKFGHFDTNFDVLFEATPDFFTHGLMVREIAEQAIVLLKNENRLLPLNAGLQSVALIGAPWYAGIAKLPVRGGDDNTPFNEPGNPPYSVTPQEGLENVLRSFGSTATVTYESGGGTGRQADIDRAVALARKSDVVIAMVGDDPSEACDLASLRLPIVPPADIDFCAWNELKPGEYTQPREKRGTGTDQEALMQALTADPAIAQKLVVVLKTQGMILMPWLDRVPAVLEAWYPGQEDGTAVANVLFGVRNPSGKLPVTFGTSEREAAYATVEQFPGVWGPAPFWSDDQALNPQYIEDLQVGYRWYEANGVRPLFPFGFGLSYTTFAYSGLSVTPSANAQGEPVLSVSYTITNTGSRQGAEASQVYLTLPPDANEPSKRLVGFQKVDLAPGASQQVTVTIDASASNHPFSYWVPVNNAPAPGWSQGHWRTPSGNYTVHVGTSSAETPLVASVPIAGDPAETAPTENQNPTAPVLWRNMKTGDVAVSSLSGFGPAVRTVVSAGVPAEWQIVGSSEGNADGSSDLIWRNTQTGDVAIWKVAGGVTTMTSVIAAGVSLEWQIVGQADLDGDSNGDIVLRNTQTGDVAVWLMNGGAIAQTAVVVPGAALEWEIVQTVDVTGDRKADLLLRNTQNGDLALWVMDGAALASAQVIAAGLPVEWTVVAGADVNSDGKSDLFLRNTSTGDLAVWFMSGDGTASSPVVPSGVTMATAVPLAWQVAGSRDVNGDGKTDLLWRNTKNGDFAVWLLDGVNVTQYMKLAPGLSLDWVLQTGAAPRPTGGASPVALLLIDSSHLGRVRDSLRRGEAQFQPALTQLAADVSQALNLAPVSVMDKAVTPPSGDKHDYLSQAPYWWPNPATPNGRPYVRRDGERNPEIDRITDRQNIARLQDAVSTLGLAYFLTGRENYAEHAADLVRVWFIDPATRMNPNLQFGQSIPGIAEGRPNGIVETRFLPDILDGITLIRGSPAWTAADDAALKAWMREYLSWLLESPLGREENRRGNNQETWYDVQVAALALYTGQPQIALTNFEDAKSDIREEIEPDGRQPHELERTRAWDYSIFNLQAFLRLATLGERVGVDLWNYRTSDGRGLQKAVDYLIPFATGEKRFPYQQITELRPSALHPILRRAAVGWNNPTYREIARQIGGGSARLNLVLP
jgi:beta-glucosidase